MSLNTCHACSGPLLHVGEYILLHCNNIEMYFHEGNKSIIRERIKADLFLTSHRIIVQNKDPGDLLQSFSAPFVALHRVIVMQEPRSKPTLSAEVRAQPNGNFNGTATFSLEFQDEGAVEFARALERVMKHVKSKWKLSELPAYEPAHSWTQQDTEVYRLPPNIHYEWISEHPAISQVPPCGVIMTLTPAPYPGLELPPPYLPPPVAPPVVHATPCGKYPLLAAAPPALGYQNGYPIGRGCCHNPNIWDKQN